MIVLKRKKRRKIPALSELEIRSCAFFQKNLKKGCSCMQWSRFWKIFSGSLSFCQKNCFYSISMICCLVRAASIWSLRWKKMTRGQYDAKVNIMYVTRLISFSYFSIIVQIFSIFEKKRYYFWKKRDLAVIWTSSYACQELRRCFFACFGQNLEKSFFMHVMLTWLWKFIICFFQIRSNHCWKSCYCHSCSRNQGISSIYLSTVPCWAVFSSLLSLVRKNKVSETISGEWTKIMW